MVGSLYSGISGIKTHQFGIDVTSNNIANVNTTGFRANSPEFSSLFASSLNYVNSNSPINNDYNYGVKIASNAINANDGSYVKSDGEFNVAYSGRGWFVVGTNKNGSFDVGNPVTAMGQNYFTRDGSFSLDGEGYLVNSSGYYMYGINLKKIAADGTLMATNDLEQDYAKLGGSTLEPIQIPKELYYRPTLTSEIGLAINLNRTQNGKPINILQDEKGDFDKEKFLNQDINTFMDSKGTPLDAQNFKDITFSITQNKQTKSYTFTYGKEGENSFTTIQELSELIKKNTGLDLGIKLDNKGLPTDSSLYLGNNTMQNITLGISGKLADKLGLKAVNQKLDSIFETRIKEFDAATDYAEGDYVKYKGLVFQKNGDGTTANNPLNDANSWKLIDTSRVETYSQNQTYQEGDLVAFEGKIYQREPNNNPQVGNPLDDTNSWKEIADSVIGEVATYQEGTNYEENSIVALNGLLYQKVNEAGDTNPLEDNIGWKIVAVNSVSSTQLQVPTYESNTEVYDESGKKFILKNQYILIEQGDQSITPPINERWEVRSAIYDATGKTLLSDTPVINEISFNPDGSLEAPVFQVPFGNGNISVDLTKSQDGKVSSNFAYADSSVKSTTQDGAPEGILKEIVINDQGIILANFTNNKFEALGRFGIAAFVNDQGLSKVGGNLLEMNIRLRNGEVSIVSGPPLLAWEDKGYAALKYGRILDHMLETSNVDTGTALTDLIIYQRGYQMSAKSITTADQLMQEAIQLKRN
ncbi:flagellar hook-basal body complex protein [Helicobacter mesocricetorum]|uniref:flagellar hook-basal body complex protein n=1 Tax=Helicobacter mesocricetorum TaxID=87012 RepID=UPI000CF11D17|nr:flagellar hook-basal body complex protein [Helicobacter mesocricetorum]